MLERQKSALYQQEMLLESAKIILYQQDMLHQQDTLIERQKCTLYQQKMLLEGGKNKLYQHTFDQHHTAQGLKGSTVHTVYFLCEIS